MKPNPPSPLVWEHSGSVKIGSDMRSRIDPGSGLSRYGRAMEALGTSGADTAFASFTFDPDEEGSVVLLPERVSGQALHGSTSQVARGHVIDDGLGVWDEGFREGMVALASGDVEKVVLARQVDVEFPEPVAIGTAISRLRVSQPGCFIFAIDGLVGASPELLVSLRDGRISSLALAGTAPTEAALEADKMAREHAHVATSVADALTRHTQNMAEPERAIVRYGAIRHLATRFNGTAKPGTTILDLVRDLHPTAAVAGSPQQAALEVIRKLEPRSRGRYAGPVGWFDAGGSGEFALALRCAHIEGTSATLYAGGGLVSGSTRNSEIAETALKLRPMLGALGVDGLH